MGTHYFLALFCFGYGYMGTMSLLQTTSVQRLIFVGGPRAMGLKNLKPSSSGLPRGSKFCNGKLLVTGSPEPAVLLFAVPIDPYLSSSSGLKLLRRVPHNQSASGKRKFEFAFVSTWCM